MDVALIDPSVTVSVREDFTKVLGDAEIRTCNRVSNAGGVPYCECVCALVDVIGKIAVDINGKLEGPEMRCTWHCRFI